MILKAIVKACYYFKVRKKKKNTAFYSWTYYVPCVLFGHFFLFLMAILFKLRANIKAKCHIYF